MSKKPTYEELEKRIQELEQSEPERKRIEEALWESEAKYRDIIENIEDGYYEVDIAGNFTFFNKSMCRILGYSTDELMGRNNREYMDGKNAKKIFQVFHDVYQTGIATKALDWKLIKKDGSECFVETMVSLIMDSNNKKVGFRGVARNITERKQADENLRESDERYRGLFERSREYVYLCDFEGNFIDANNAALEGLGYTKKDIKSLNFMSLLDKDQLPRAIESLEEILKTGSHKGIVEFRLKRKDGVHIDIESKGAIIYADGKPYAIQGIARDITERKKLEEERSKLIYELRQALEKVKQLGGLLPICSHCKKIRDDKGYWNQIESYIRDHSEVEFSHGICQECAEKHYPDMGLYDDDDDDETQD